VVVLLDSWGKHSRIGDANRIKKWLESGAASGRSS
jgi:D-alanyl-D-alanine endopeptidase (penicillin-binding protein 7)